MPKKMEKPKKSVEKKQTPAKDQAVLNPDPKKGTVKKTEKPEIKETKQQEDKEKPKIEAKNPIKETEKKEEKPRQETVKKEEPAPEIEQTEQKKASEQKDDKKNKKIYIAIFIVVFLVIVGTIAFLIYQSRQNKALEAKKTYLSLQAKKFKDTIEEINDLDTEKTPFDSTDDPDEYIEKQNEELASIKDALELIKRNKETLADEPEEMENLKESLDQLYSNSEKALKDYQLFIEYDKQIMNATKDSADLYTEYDKTMKKQNLTDEELIEAITKLRDGYQRILDALENIEPHERVEELHSSLINHFRKYLDSLNNTLEAANQKEWKLAKSEISSFYTERENDEYYSLIEKLAEEEVKNYQKHFKELRREADRMKTLFISKKIKLESHLPELEIEAW
ncbi:MAG: hypothetical protein GF347_01105 [Candidatus Moranbacteria bacterium]|nr:hypothetical protein [Candidatus Moranbacteria bacterium]